MANKTKNESAAKKAAEQQAAPKAETKVVNPANKISKGLSQEAKVAYLTAIQKERDEARRDNDTDTIQYAIGAYNMLAQATILDIAVGEIACGTSALGMIVSNNAEAYGSLCAMAAQLGVSLPEFKSLPAPTKEQLAQAGLSEINGNGAKLLLIDNKAVSKEAKEKKKREKAIEAKVKLDPTKIENETQLREQLTQCFLGSENPVLRIQNAINFYNTYLTFEAKKSEDAEKKLAEVKNMSRIDMLRKITEIVGDCTFAMSGISHYLKKAANETQSPISAFCLYKRACESAGDRAKVDDAFVADAVKILITWSCNSQIKQLNDSIEKSKKTIEKLKSDKKSDAKVIAAESASVNYNENEIVGIQSIIDCVNHPSFDAADNLIDNYRADEGSVRCSNAHRIVSNIMDTYYKGEDLKKYTEDSVLNVAKHHAGEIINMFVDPLSQSINYKDGVVPSFVEKKEDEKKLLRFQIIGAALAFLALLKNLKRFGTDIIGSINLSKMKKLTTILCSIAFAVAGISMAITASDPSRSMQSYRTIAAASMPNYVFPRIGLDTCTIDVPEDLLRDLAKKKGVMDTVYFTKTDTIEKQVTKVKWRTVPVPKPVIKRDTIQVPVYYLATQVGNKEGPTDQCISVYEVHKVDEICPEITNSSVKSTNTQNTVVEEQ